MKHEPLVSVMMAAYNAENYIRDAISSIVRQTYSNWELIVLNDGSTDATKNIVNEFSDSRIRYFENTGNRGLVYTRNRMVSLCKGRYLAILDSDDISHPKRLQKEVCFLEKHRDFGLVGGGIEMIDTQGNLTGARWIFFERSAKIPTTLIFNNYFAHSTVMIRREALPEPAYRGEYPPAEDYDLWIRISQNWKVHSFKEVFVKYRVHSTNTSFSNKPALEAAEKRIFLENLGRVVSASISEREQEMLYRLVYGRFLGLLSYNDFLQLTDTLESVWRHRTLLGTNVRPRYFATELLRHYFFLLNFQNIPHLRKIPHIFRIKIGTFFSKLAFFVWLIEKKLRPASRA